MKKKLFNLWQQLQSSSRVFLARGAESILSFIELPFVVVIKYLLLDVSYWSCCFIIKGSNTPRELATEQCVEIQSDCVYKI